MGNGKDSWTCIFLPYRASAKIWVPPLRSPVEGSPVPLPSSHLLDASLGLLQALIRGWIAVFPGAL